jgi:hypothetical protein
MQEKVLVRRTRDAQIVLFVPSRPAPKGYILQWAGNTDFVDVPLEVYKTTADCSDQETKRKVSEYKKALEVDDLTVCLRLPKDYQKTGLHDDYVLKPAGASLVIEDVHGKFIIAYTNKEQALRAMNRLKQGKSIL